MQNVQSNQNGNTKYSYLLMLGHMCNDVSQGALPALLPFLVINRGLDYASAAGLLFATSFFSSILQPFLGMMTDKRPMPWLIPAGMLVSALGISIVGILDSYWLIFVSVLFAGLGSAMFHPEAARMSNFVAGSKKGQGISLFAVGGNLGFILGPLVITAAVSLWGLKGTLVLFVPVLCIALIFLSLQKKFSQFSGILSKDEKIARREQGKKDNAKEFMLLCLPLFIRSIINTGLQVFIPLYWIGGLLQSQQRGSLMVTVMGLAAAVATLISGRIADRFGFRKVIVLSFATIAPLVVCLLMTKNVFSATLIVLVLAASVSFSYSPMVVLGQKYLPNHLGLASGVTLGLSVSVGGIFSPLLGRVGDSFGLTVALYTIAGIAFLGFIGTLFIKEAKL